MRGWCPTLFEPMPTGDGLLVRIKPPGGLLTPAAAQALAEAASSYGNGVIDLTSRANLQVRGLTHGVLPLFTRAILAAGLADPDPGNERRRNVITTPLAGDDPAAHPQTRPITAALERLLADPTLSALPPKFGFAINGGGLLPIPHAPADIRITVAADSWAVTPDRGNSTPSAPDEAAPLAIHLARSFLSVASPETRRMRDLVRTHEPPAPAPTSEPIPVGWHPYKNAFPLAAEGRVRVGAPADSIRPSAQAGAFGVALPFGTTTATDLHHLATLAATFGATLRLTPWRAILLTPIRAPDLPALCQFLAPLPFITEPTDPRLAISACPGHPACASATVDTRALARALTPSGPVHISGCSKGCAHPGPARITLVGNAGHYDFIRNGRASDAPVARALTTAEAAALT
jgi:precorrin-3B synthase